MIGDRIKKLRLDRRWTQIQLAKKINIQQKQISGYESGTQLPSTETLIKLAEVFETSLDYLAFESAKLPIRIQDQELLNKIQILDRLPEREKELAKQMLDLLILKDKFRELVS